MFMTTGYSSFSRVNVNWHCCKSTKFVSYFMFKFSGVFGELNFGWFQADLLTLKSCPKVILICITGIIKFISGSF